MDSEVLDQETNYLSVRVMLQVKCEIDTAKKVSGLC